MNTLRAGALGLVLALSGCAVATPPVAVPALPPPAWSAPLPHGGRDEDIARWWQRLADPLLPELIAAAQDASPGLASAQARIAQARATRIAAGAALLPSLDGNASAQRGNLQAPPTLATTAQVGAQAAWEIDLFGGRSLAAQAAEARLRGAEAGWHEARVAVAAETASSYFGLRSCARQLAVAERDAASRAETSRLTGLSADAGFTAPANAALARASAAESALRLVQQRAQCETELKSLVVLTGLEEARLRQRLAATQPAAAPEALFEVAALPARVLAQRPDVYQAELEVAAASADVGAADAQRYPRLTLSGAVAAGRIHTAGATGDAQTWAIGPLALSLPLLDAGRRAADTEAARARYDEAVALYRARVRQAVGEVEQALVALDSARAGRQDALTAAQGYRDSFAATEARYRSGLASLFELEDARRTQLAAETALVGLERELQQAWIALYRAAGGGWEREAALATTGPRPDRAFHEAPR